MAAVEVARSYAQITTAIWSDPDFRCRSAHAQRLYLFLVSQADLSLVGVIHTRIGPWSRTADDLNPFIVQGALAELDACDLIVWDRNEEEVWVRGFIRRYLVSPQAYLGAGRALGAVASRTITERILEEIHPDLRTPFAAAFDRMKYEDVRTLIASVGEWERPPKRVTDTQGDTQSDTQDDALFATGDLIPETGDLRPKTVSLVTATPRPSPKSPIAYTPAFLRWWIEYPNKANKQEAFRKYEKAAGLFDEQALLDGMRAWVAYWRAMGTAMEFIPRGSTFLHRGQYETPPPGADTRTEKQRRFDADEARFLEEYGNGQAIDATATATETHAIQQPKEHTR